MRVLAALLLLMLAGCGEDRQPLLPCIATVLWAAPAERLSGELLPADELAKFTIFVNRLEGRQQKSVEFTIDVTDVHIIQWEIRRLTKGTHWFYLSVTDTDNVESGFSNEMSKVCQDLKEQM